MRKFRRFCLQTAVILLDISACAGAGVGLYLMFPPLAWIFGGAAAGYLAHHLVALLE